MRGLTELFDDDRGQLQGMDLPGVLIMLVVAGTVGFIGLFIMSDVITQTALDAGGPNTSADPLYNASQSLRSAVNSAFSLVGLAFTVVILVVIIIYLYAVRNTR